MGQLDGRVAVVTGGSRGIGKAIARRFAAEGAAVGLTSRSAEPGSHELGGSLAETVAEIDAAGGRACAVGADLSDPALDRAALVDRIEAELGPVDVVVNNAAAPRTFHIGYLDMDRPVFAETVEVNVWAAWELGALVARRLVDRGAPGWILNISSRSAGPKQGPPYPASSVGAQTLYGASKAMLDRLTTGAAMELHGRSVAVNALAPESAVRTENAAALVDLPESTLEPLEAFAEAALALCTGDPGELTGRIAYTLSLLIELDRPVRTLDGRALLAGWQPADIDRARLRAAYCSTRPPS